MSVEERLLRLEGRLRKVQFANRLMFLAIASLLGILLLGAQSLGNIDCRKLTVRDDNGSPVITMSMSVDGTGEIKMYDPGQHLVAQIGADSSLVSAGTTGTPWSIRFFDCQGTDRMRLGVNSAGFPVIYLQDVRKVTRVIMGETEGGRLGFSDQNGVLVGRVKEEDGTLVFTPARKPGP